MSRSTCPPRLFWSSAVLIVRITASFAVPTFAATRPFWFTVLARAPKAANFVRLNVRNTKPLSLTGAKRRAEFARMNAYLSLQR